MMKRFCVLALAMGWAFLSYSQPDNPVAPVPLDGGISLLVAGAVALGYRQYKKKDTL